MLWASLENAAELVPWEERASLESRERREDSGPGAPVGKREMTGETELAVKDKKAKKEKEDSLDTQVQRVPVVSQGQTEH